MRLRVHHVSERPGERKIMNEAGIILGQETKVGRRSDCQVLIMSSITVSRLHAIISRRADGLFEIVDQNSTNGTWINGEKITSKILLPGDEISFGANVYDKLKIVGNTDFTAVLMNNSSEESIRRVARFAAQLRKRGFTVMVLTPELTRNPEGPPVLWKIDQETDKRWIGEWLDPFSSRYNQEMGYLLVYVSQPCGGTYPNIVPQVIDIISRVNAILKPVLCREGSREDLAQPVIGLNDHELYSLTRKMDRLRELFRRGSWEEIEIREGFKLILPTRKDVIWGVL